MTTNDQKSCAYFSVKSKYRNIIPETSNLTWDDLFFQKNDTGADDVVAVFDFDHDRVIRFWIQKAITRQAFLLIVVTFLFSSQYAKDEPFLSLLPTILYILSGAPFFLFSQVRWKAYSMHCAVTQEGIIAVTGPQKTLWGLSFCTREKQTKMIRFEEIKDCEIFEPIGNVYFCIPEALTTVIVDKKWRGRVKPEIILPGLKDPYSFKRLVWAMKQGKEDGGSIAYKAPTNPRTKIKPKSNSNQLMSIAEATSMEMSDIV